MTAMINGQSSTLKRNFICSTNITVLPCALVLKSNSTSWIFTCILNNQNAGYNPRFSCSNAAKEREAKSYYVS